MNKRKNKVRAVFLLSVFSLNTLAGFACSVGIDLYYNTNHHSHSLNSHVKTHTHDSKHQHKHSHTEVDMQSGDQPEKDDCCTDEVTKFAQLDKSVANCFLLQAPVFIKIIPEFYLLSTLQPVQAISVNSNFQFVRRSCSIYDTDIRIAIQSFQI
jgi:hypothetical protein